MRVDEIVRLNPFMISMRQLKYNVRQHVRGDPIDIHQLVRQASHRLARLKQTREPFAPVPTPPVRRDGASDLSETEYVDLDAGCFGGDGQHAFGDVFRFAVAHWEGNGVVGRGEGFFGDEGGVGVAGGVIGDRGDGGDEQDAWVLGACDAPVDKVADATNVIFEGL